MPVVEPDALMSGELSPPPTSSPPNLRGEPVGLRERPCESRFSQEASAAMRARFPVRGSPFQPGRTADGGGPLAVFCDPHRNK
ncbi:hypothetical protein ACFQ9J_17335 [Streptomyces sp. NPDC056529]|uniref:hypothetical protein n=1 Tax=Streptomyces sp. NPDC056529 TaxID=3345855 RepID=UPI00369F5053